VLLYDSPSNDWYWRTASPGMDDWVQLVFGGHLEKEHLQFNDESLWAGKPENP